jgi:hypothetical protein
LLLRLYEATVKFFCETFNLLVISACCKTRKLENWTTEEFHNLQVQKPQLDDMRTEKKRSETNKQTKTIHGRDNLVHN